MYWLVLVFVFATGAQLAEVDSQPLIVQSGNVRLTLGQYTSYSACMTARGKANAQSSLAFQSLGISVPQDGWVSQAVCVTDPNAKLP